MFPTEPAAVSRGFGAVLKNRSFMLVWIGQAICQLADKIFFVLAIALLEKYPPEPGALEDNRRLLIYLAFTLPAVLLGSVGGVIVDRFPKKPIMIGSDLLRGILTIAIPFLPREFLILLFITFGNSLIVQFFAPAEQAAIPILVKRENLMAANALFTSTMMGAIIVGFGVGESLLSLGKNLIGYQYGQEFIVGALYLISSLIKIPVNLAGRQIKNKPKTSFNPWMEFKDSLRHLKKNRLVLNAMLQLTALYCVFAALIALSIRLTQEFGLEEKQFGFFLAAAGVGIVLGAAILGHWGDRFHHKPLPLFGFLCMAFVLAVFTFTHSLLIALGLCAILGLGAATIGVPMQTLIQQQTPPAMHGKVFGFQNHVVNIALTVPLLVTERLTNAIGLRYTLISISAVVAMIGIWAWRNTRRVLKDVI
ncbi:MAG: MFS transporter [Mastigocoleus sp. MO_167.B18]|uniref:MFS transporter n=1 Tax=Mastigocoleus sp. MO_188.B34 TaxID=3036635 RepID=UPI00261A9A5A|nr:MFS transporter [Mastigocoleus sp. MO_188.B34]MDJ0696889.1 MFS transporter [Mastigocoleus sp. MO_188.B34]MDJ0775500.1 MFS transporter [Mastigocoleus sp. MO_167.B18]